LHANIAEKLQTEVTDALTGDVVGSVAVPPAMGVGLGGKGRRVLVAREGRVITEATGIAEIANFGGGSAKSTGPALATALLRGAGIPAPCRAQVAGAHMIFHGLGTAGGLLLAKVFQRSGLDVVHAGRFAVLLEEEPEAWPLPEGLETALGLSYSGIGHDLEMGAWHDLLPHEEQRAAVAAQCPLDAVRALLSTPPPVVATADPELWEEAAWA
jgi:hypothetical protein